MTTDARPICHSTSRMPRIGNERQKPLPALAAEVSRTSRSPKPAAILNVQGVALPWSGSTSTTWSWVRARTTQAWPGWRPRIKNGGAILASRPGLARTLSSANPKRAASLCRHARSAPTSGRVTAARSSASVTGRSSWRHRRMKASKHAIRCYRLRRRGVGSNDRRGGHPALRPRGCRPTSRTARLLDEKRRKSNYLGLSLLLSRARTPGT